MKQRIWLLLLVGCVMMSPVLQAGSRIAFSTDRTTDDEFDLWRLNPVGLSQNPTEITDETNDIRRPSISHDGEFVVFDMDDEIYITENDGANTTNLDACESPVKCFDADAGPRINSEDDFRIVYIQKDGNTHNIYTAEVDVSTKTLSNDPVQITDVDSEQLQFEPSWCRSDWIVWSRFLIESSFYEREICTVEVDDEGMVGTPTCYFSETDVDDGAPSCSPDGTKIAWARENEYYYNHDIWVMDCIDEGVPDLENCDDANADSLMESDDTYQDYHPTWSPDGTEISFASDRDDTGSDFDCYKMDSDTGNHKKNLTDDSSDEDTECDWGVWPAVH